MDPWNSNLHQPFHSTFVSQSMTLLTCIFFKERFGPTSGFGSGDGRSDPHEIFEVRIGPNARENGPFACHWLYCNLEIRTPQHNVPHKGRFRIGRDPQSHAAPCSIADGLVMDPAVFYPNGQAGEGQPAPDGFIDVDEQA